MHTGGTDTEYAAAASVEGHSKRLRATVLGIITSRWPEGVTDDEGGRLLQEMVPSADRLTFGRRRHELVIEGLVRDSTYRRLTPAGRSAIVWVAVR